MKLTQKYRGVFQFIRRERRDHVTAAAFAFLAAIALAIYLKSSSVLQDLWSFWEPVTGVATLGIAVLLWWGEAEQDWESSLPKRVTAVFMYPGDPKDSASKGKVAMVCTEAYLSGEGDLRAWSMQLGAQMAGSGQLAFTPFIEEMAGKIAFSADGQAFKPYWTVFQLTEIPPAPTNPKPWHTALQNGKTIQLTRDKITPVEVESLLRENVIPSL